MGLSVPQRGMIVTRKWERRLVGRVCGGGCVCARAMDSRPVAGTYPSLIQTPLVQLDSATFGSYQESGSRMTWVCPCVLEPQIETSQGSGEKDYYCCWMEEISIFV